MPTTFSGSHIHRWVYPDTFVRYCSSCGESQELDGATGLWGPRSASPAPVTKRPVAPAVTTPGLASYVDPIFGVVLSAEPGRATFLRSIDGTETELTSEMVIRIATALHRVGAITPRVAETITEALGTMKYFGDALNGPTSADGAIDAIVSDVRSQPDPAKRLELVSEYLTKITNQLTELTRERDEEGGSDA